MADRGELAEQDEFLLVFAQPPGHVVEVLGEQPELIEPVDGYYPLPEGPGLGIDIVERELMSRPYRGSWHRGDRVNPDNSIAFI